MRKLALVIALFGCSTQAMAQDPCVSLQGKLLRIDGNGFKGVIGPNGIKLVNQNNVLTFQTTANFFNEPSDPVTGQCQNRHITFTRTRSGVFVQNYDGFLLQADPSKMSGLFTHNKLNGFKWQAEAKIAPPPLPACEDVNGGDCVHAKNLSNTTKKQCSKSGVTVTCYCQKHIEENVGEVWEWKCP